MPPCSVDPIFQGIGTLSWSAFWLIGLRISAPPSPLAKKKTPPAPQKKNVWPGLRKLLLGEFAPRARGEGVTKYDPKNGNGGMIVPDHPDERRCPDSAVSGDGW